MKRITISYLLCCLLAYTAYSQTSIEYSVHTLQAGVDNPMCYCSYAEPGLSGQGVRWDFTGLTFDRPFTGFVQTSKITQNQQFFPKANTELGEFDAKFYFDVNKNETDQYGYISSDGKTKEIYSVPFIKMKYPFHYGDSYSGVISGTYEYADVVKGDISGVYNVEADAFGTLILPGPVTFDNVLRVKTTKNYTIHFQSSDQEVSISTYRWYNAVHRYPILVLTEYKTKTGESVGLNYQAAYNSSAITSLPEPGSIYLSELSLFPNPVENALMIKGQSGNTGLLSFEICDISGKTLRYFTRELSVAGSFEFDLSSEINNLKPAQYLLLVNDGKSRNILDFSLVK